MSVDDLEAAARSARYLANMACSIIALRAEGANQDAIYRLQDELNQNLPAASEAIRRVAGELKLIRNAHVRLGDIVAPTAHEAAVKMVMSLNGELCRERFPKRLHIEILGKRHGTWPNADEVVAEIEIELAKAKSRRTHGTEVDKVPPSPPPKEPTQRPLTVDLNRKTITLNGKTYDVIKSDRALRWVKVLAEHPGEWISSKNLINHDKELTTDRPDRLKRFLPKAVLTLIDSDKRGSRLRNSQPTEKAGIKPC